jgi:hypothetical protein
MSRKQHFLDCGCKKCVNDLLEDIDRLTTEVKAGKNLWVEAQTRRKFLALEVDDLQAELKKAYGRMDTIEQALKESSK